MPKIDSRASRIFLLASVFALVVIGLIMVYSATSASLVSQGANPYEDVSKQVLFVVIGTGLMLLFLLAIPYQNWRGKLMWAYYWFCILLIILTFFLGTEVNGARRWLYLGQIGFQPSEFVKIALLLMTINIVYNYSEGFLEFRAAITRFLIAVVLPLGFILLTQSDLGSAAITLVGIIAILWIGGVNRKYLAIIIAAIVVVVLVAIFGVGYRSSRLVYLNPWNDGQNGLGSGYNIIHAYYAISEGGLFGVGLGSSHEKYSYLFASDSDFIYAIICEETGMLGGLVVICLFIVILYAGLRIAAQCPDRFGKMVSGGFAIMLVFQAFLNIGSTIGVLPTTGKPLPFISSGGSSAISSLMIIGLMLEVSKGTELMTDVGRKRDNFRIMRNVDRSPTNDSRTYEPAFRRTTFVDDQWEIQQGHTTNRDMSQGSLDKVRKTPGKKRYRFEDLDTSARGGADGQERGSNRGRNSRSRLSGTGTRRNTGR